MIDLSLDMTKYSDINAIKNHDLFIDQNGDFYKIRPIKGMSLFNHNTWAKMYLDKLNYDLDQRFSPSEVLVHVLGFVYYSHDQLKFKPIIKIADPWFCNMNTTKAQLDSLYNVMIVNGENPNIVPMLMGEEGIYDYEGIDDTENPKIKKYI